MILLSRYLPDGTSIYRLLCSIVFLLAFFSHRSATPVTESLMHAVSYVGLPTEWIALLQQWADDRSSLLTACGLIALFVSAFGFAAQDVSTVLHTRAGATGALAIGLLVNAGWNVWLATAIIVVARLTRVRREGATAPFFGVVVLFLAAWHAPLILGTWLIGEVTDGRRRSVWIEGGEVEIRQPVEPRGAVVERVL